MIKRNPTRRNECCKNHVSNCSDQKFNRRIIIYARFLFVFTQIEIENLCGISLQSSGSLEINFRFHQIAIKFRLN